MPLDLIRVTGGMQIGASIDSARAGAHRWQRATGEEEVDFIERAMREAEALGERGPVVIGGLPEGTDLPCR